MLFRSLEEANTNFAQGGVASVTNVIVDDFEKHIEDTMIAGDFISDRAAVEQVVRMAPSQIKELVNWGVNFDRKEDGEFDLHREGGTSRYYQPFFRRNPYQEQTRCNGQKTVKFRIFSHPLHDMPQEEARSHNGQEE